MCNTDVQVLFDPLGRPLMIDLTEASRLHSPPTFLELAQSRSFLSEVSGFVPQTFESDFMTKLAEELRGAHASSLEPAIHKMLRDFLLD